jgi:hypothetical protein
MIFHSSCPETSPSGQAEAKEASDPSLREMAFLRHFSQTLDIKRSPQIQLHIESGQAIQNNIEYIVAPTQRKAMKLACCGDKLTESVT